MVTILFRQAIQIGRRRWWQRRLHWKKFNLFQD